MRIITKKSVNQKIEGKSCNPNLSPGVVYHVVGFDDECFRVINDACEPILYPKNLFDVLDSTVPEDWVRVDFEDGEYHVNPQQFSMPGFYEDYFDGVPEAVEAFRLYLSKNKICPSM